MIKPSDHKILMVCLPKGQGAGQPPSRTAGRERARDFDVDRARLADNVANALLLATALNSTLGYDCVAAIARKAMTEWLTPPAAIALGLTTADAYDRLVDLVAMTSTGAGRRRDPYARIGSLSYRTNLSRCDV